MQGVSRFEGHAHGVKRIAIRSFDFQPVAEFSVIGTRAGRELGGAETNPRNVSHLHSFLKWLGLNPGSAEKFKWGIGATPDRDATGLKGFDSRVNEILVYGAQVRRGRNPFHSCLVVGLAAPPILHLDDVQISAGLVLR